MFSTSDSHAVVCGEKHPTQYAVCHLDWPHEGKDHEWFPALVVATHLDHTFTPQRFHTPFAGSAR